MRTVLICHHDAHLDREVLPRWLASFSELAGLVVIRESKKLLWRRARRELKRSGVLGLADVVAFRLFYRLALARRDSEQERGLVRRLEGQHARAPSSTPAITVESPNVLSAASFMREARPDIVLARCKHLLKREVFTIARTGTFVMHPGICPEYRNAHGCFWALARGDRANVGMTLLKIDEGIDTGPVYGYFRRPLEDPAETHVSIQNRVVFENLPAIQEALLRIHAGLAQPIDVTGRQSTVWGLPRLTAYCRWRLRT